MALNFPGRIDAVDQFAHRAAAEAVSGLQIQGKPVTEHNVNDWLKVALDGDMTIIARAMHFAQRMIHGPVHPDWPAAPSKS